jgi:glyoxylase-like metal-dependent hydrolase (beta-lactamase superfamily II)
MIKSLKRLLALPPETKVYPGHGNPTTIAAEQKVIATAW